MNIKIVIGVFITLMFLLLISNPELINKIVGFVLLSISSVIGIYKILEVEKTI